MPRAAQPTALGLRPVLLLTDCSSITLTDVIVDHPCAMPFIYSIKYSLFLYFDVAVTSQALVSQHVLSDRLCLARRNLWLRPCEEIFQRKLMGCQFERFHAACLCTELCAACLSRCGMS